MKNRVVLKRKADDRAALVPGHGQSWLYPDQLFELEPERQPRWWSCVRTRPRWEKKFAGWLQERKQAYFLPLFEHVTESGRKRRTSLLPLFPGFVFVAGVVSKKDYVQTGAVAYVLQPRGSSEAGQLDRELRNIWRGLTSGWYVEPVHNLAAGERCRIVAGPLQGVEAVFERAGAQGRLVLQVEMMGGGIAVEIPAGEVEVTE